jgi:hypothetical protein
VRKQTDKRQQRQYELGFRTISGYLELDTITIGTFAVCPTLKITIWGWCDSKQTRAVTHCVIKVAQLEIIQGNNVCEVLHLGSEQYVYAH